MNRFVKIREFQEVWLHADRGVPGYSDSHSLHLLELIRQICVALDGTTDAITVDPAANSHCTYIRSRQSLQAIHALTR